MTRRWSATEVEDAKRAFGEIVASGVFGTKAREVDRVLHERMNAVVALGEQTDAARAALFALMEEIDRAAPGAAARLFPVSNEAMVHWIGKAQGES